MLLRLPVHPRRPLVENLHPVATHIPLPRVRVLRNHHRPGNEPPAILRPTFQYRKIIQGKIVGAHHFLARPAAHHLREKRPDLRQLRQHLHLFKKSLRRLHIDKRMHPLRDLFQRLHFQRQAHPLQRAHQIGHHRHPRSLRPLKQQRRPAGLHRAIRYLRDLVHRIHFNIDPAQLILFVQRVNEVPQIPVRHFPSACSDK